MPIQHVYETQKGDIVNKPSKHAVVVGSGAGGCMAARELALRGFEVTLVEAGRAFKPFTLDMRAFEPARQAGLFFDAHLIEALFPPMRIDTAQDGMVHVRGRAVGGTTTLATGNALRYDRYLACIGIDLDEEFSELEHEVPMTTGHRARWSELTERLFATFEELGLDPEVTPKFMEDPERCVACGNCVLGCRFGAKWTADKLVRDVAGIELMDGARVHDVVIENGRTTGVTVRQGLLTRRLDADLVVLAAGGLGTPQILEASGIPASPTLFVDPVLCIAAPWKGAGLDRQLPMPFVSQQEDYILSPYFDWLSFYFNKSWRMPSSNIMSIMIKMADTSVGSFADGRLDKPLQDADYQVLARAVDQVYAVFEAMGVPAEQTFYGTLNAGHPGGCYPLTQAEAETLHHATLPHNLYIADASLFPRAMGNPPMLTIMALAKRVARTACDTRG